MADGFRATCGANRALSADLVGCGGPILNQRELYRCTHCGVPFHHACALRHFAVDSEAHGDAAITEQLRRWDEKTKEAGEAEYLSWHPSGVSGTPAQGADPKPQGYDK